VNYGVVVAHEAEKVLDRLDRPTERRIRARFLQLSADPFDPRLSGPLTERSGVRKSRVGGWRILFTGIATQE
jgi:mRNA-degrading endonuclease RelE of RelBE toxin-antitoxin system